MRLKEEIIREIIEEKDAFDEENILMKAWWKGYLTALRTVINMPPDDDLIEKEYYD